MRNNSRLMKNHVVDYPRFKGLYLSELTAGKIRDWMIWEARQGISPNQINKALKAMRVAVRYAVGRDELRSDPFLNISPIVETASEKGVLTRPEVGKIIRYKGGDRLGHLAVLFGLLGGMRIGEVRGMQYEDIEGNEVHLRHNWQDLEGLKSPKCKSFRTIPIHKVIAGYLGKGTGFIFPSPVKPDEPVSRGYLRNTLIKELEGAGITENEQRRRNISFHSLRHTFITLGRLGGLTDPEIQALAGHKRLSMTDRYSHAAQVMDYGEVGIKLENAMTPGEKKRQKKGENCKKRLDKPAKKGENQNVQAIRRS
jgi:integrase